MSSKGLFISGTDTDVGKSFACAFVRTMLKTMDIEALYYKPIQCGPGELNQETLEGGDPELQTHLLDYRATLCSYNLQTPASPHYALAVENEVFALGLYQDTLALMAQQHPFTVIEGAGGVRVPIDDKLEMSDLAKISGYPILLVARPDLGTINHTLLSIEHLQSKQIPIAGFCFSVAHKDFVIDKLVESNYRTIAQRSEVDFLGFIPHWEQGWSEHNFIEHPLQKYLESLF